MSMTQRQHDIARAVRRKVDQLKEWQQSHGDAWERLDHILCYWFMGLQGEIPPEFNDIVTQMDKEVDPEWVEYQRLKEKFDD